MEPALPEPSINTHGRGDMVAVKEGVRAPLPLPSPPPPPMGAQLGDREAQLDPPPLPPEVLLEVAEVLGVSVNKYVWEQGATGGTTRFGVG